MSDFIESFVEISKIIFPNRCSLCGEVIELDQEVCDCCDNPPVIDDPICTNCGVDKKDCNCKGHKNEYVQIVAPYYYQDCLVNAIHRFKEMDMPFLADRMGLDIYNCIQNHYCDISFDAVTFVPMRRLHKLKRGFNQSELLANVVGEYLNVPVIDYLEKVRYIGVQHHKSADERKADVFGSYGVKDEYKNQLDGKTILLLDDVKTTGSTLNECAKMLKIYGAKAVYCAAVAITNYNHKKTISL